jgi:hypothetical protein
MVNPVQKGQSINILPYTPKERMDNFQTVCKSWRHSHRQFVVHPKVMTITFDPAIHQIAHPHSFLPDQQLQNSSHPTEQK